MNPSLVPRISTRGILHVHSFSFKPTSTHRPFQLQPLFHQIVKLSTSSILLEVKNSNLSPKEGQGQKPIAEAAPGENASANPNPKLKTENEGAAGNGSGREKESGRGTGSSVIFWIGGFAVIYGAWRLERRFWRGEAQPRLGV
ncbi:hypothetical protein ONS95_005952 [Cadophora gregata]|uniref:uncharacterized protein n=1 Tax=Cadophora gregata TaxID=51156 RepID=UPI0026DC055C|nr:uncharacterized protein ONS95_005952 [Cadophora gregata]KAK0102329.1 hypothetical protein ONS95_005952 [Cadophora gregata]KAK0103954.1 hypothetical protein ONS96_005060 [Cadophora gregata f. sp. sojae]